MSKVGRVFSVAVPRLWNSLPLFIIPPHRTNSFILIDKRHLSPLKTLIIHLSVCFVLLSMVSVFIDLFNLFPNCVVFIIILFCLNPIQIWILCSTLPEADLTWFNDQDMYAYESRNCVELVHLTSPLIIRNLALLTPLTGPSAETPAKGYEFKSWSIGPLS